MFHIHRAFQVSRLRLARKVSQEQGSRDHGRERELKDLNEGGLSGDSPHQKRTHTQSEHRYILKHNTFLISLRLSEVSWPEASVPQSESPTKVQFP